MIQKNHRSICPDVFLLNTLSYNRRANKGPYKLRPRAPEYRCRLSIRTTFQVLLEHAVAATMEQSGVNCSRPHGDRPETDPRSSDRQDIRSKTSGQERKKKLPLGGAVSTVARRGLFHPSFVACCATDCGVTGKRALL
ncbi:hypothetical protein CEXT_706791 [Caerostris extrusa]|uniref:Uncharacterized protein n=1 Tax=Caerostris extrusa TaxID=172846 RepID=A0AAV4Q0E1_CAEEX|nr:hypothetical protein CEXT_706791 [Caerostris extrusa]